VGWFGNGANDGKRLGNFDLSTARMLRLSILTEIKKRSIVRPDEFSLFYSGVSADKRPKVTTRCDGSNYRFPAAAL
jgi:hypothetical protein